MLCLATSPPCHSRMQGYSQPSRGRHTHLCSMVSRASWQAYAWPEHSELEQAHLPERGWRLADRRGGAAGGTAGINIGKFIVSMHVCRDSDGTGNMNWPACVQGHASDGHC